MKLTLLLTSVFFLCLFSASATAAAEGKRPMKVEDLFRYLRVTDPQVSLDGQLVVYVVTTVDFPNNKSSSALWTAPTEGGAPRQLTNPGAGKKDRHPRLSPDGKQVLFESNRSGDNQLWAIALAGGEARQLTTIATEASNGQWSPDGTQIAFTSTVWPEYSSKPYAESNELNRKRKEEVEKGPVKARVFTKLFFRHWDEYVQDKRQHLFVMDAPQAQGSPALSLPRDVTPGDRDANPTSSTFSGGDDFSFSPDGKYLIFTAPPERDEAWSTNYDLCRVSTNGGKIETLTGDNPAADGAPRFAPSGRQLVYRAQKRQGAEADKWDVMLVDCDASGAFTGKPKNLTAKHDLSFAEYAWAPDNQLYLAADADGGTRIFLLASDGAKLTPVMPGTQKPTDKPDVFMSGSLTTSRDGKTLVFGQSAMDRPPEVFVAVNGGAPRSVSDANAKINSEIDRQRPEYHRVKVEGAEMQMWILKPPGFDPKKKWPVAYMVHGGPQGAWEDGWSYRWNPQLWAAQGYVVALPNPRGSTGFGQKFCDDISGDWGGKCFDDLMKGADYVEALPYVDKDRIGAAGASFGGYMMNWFQAKTPRFKTLITHCGVFNFDSMYATTEELWFDEWEHGGLPWEKPEAYRKHSPHLFAKNFKTPMLVIHNDLDFRVPVSEGVQLFTTLQRLRIPSKMINFPDEGHWVQKPANSKFWHDEVFAWLAKYVPPGGK